MRENQYVGRMYLEKLRGLFESVCLARAQLRLDHLVWKILTVSVERGLLNRAR